MFTRKREEYEGNIKGGQSEQQLKMGEIERERGLGFRLEGTTHDVTIFF